MSAAEEGGRTGHILEERSLARLEAEERTLQRSATCQCLRKARASYSFHCLSGELLLELVSGRCTEANLCRPTRVESSL
jgi:hypothetical protein